MIFCSEPPIEDVPAATERTSAATSSAASATSPDCRDVALASTMIWIAVVVSCSLACATVEAESRISRTVAAIFSTNRLKDLLTSVNWSCPVVSSRNVRSPSPSAMSASRSCRALSGRMIDRAMRIASTIETTSVRLPTRVATWLVRVAVLSARAWAAASSCRALSNSRSTPPAITAYRSRPVSATRSLALSVCAGVPARYAAITSSSMAWNFWNAARIVATSACAAALGDNFAVASSSRPKLSIAARNAARSGAVSAVASGAPRTMLNA